VGRKKGSCGGHVAGKSYRGGSGTHGSLLPTWNLRTSGNERQTLGPISEKMLCHSRGWVVRCGREGVAPSAWHSGDFMKTAGGKLFSRGGSNIDRGNMG